MSSFEDLSPVQARVLACLVEKSRTTPQYYPMTVNALTNAANQKSCRNPVMALSEGEVGSALSDLEGRQLVSRVEDGGRAVKWRHRMQHQFLLKPESMAILVTLMLRGPQTVSELRSNATAVGGPDSTEAVVEMIEDLTDRAQPMVQALPRGHGQKEARFAHRLCGEPDIPPTVAPARERGRAGDGLERRLAELEARVTELEQKLSAGG